MARIARLVHHVPPASRITRPSGRLARAAALGGAMLSLTLAPPAFAQLSRGVEYTEEFFLGDCTFTPDGGNRFFILDPCHQLFLSGEDDGELVELYITVLDQTLDITLIIEGVPTVITTRVVEERELVDGELYEISRNYFARCVETGSVFYFGEDVCFYGDGVCVSADGSWRAGVNGATPGIIMPGDFLLGSRYYQELAPGIALDRAEHAAMGLTLDTPAGTLTRCVEVLESSPLDAGAESRKFYCPGIGLVQDGPIELVSHGFVDCPVCEADYNADGLDDILDFLAFIDDFAACEDEPAPCGTLGNPDVNGDTVVDILDFLEFIEAFSEGC